MSDHTNDTPHNAAEAAYLAAANARLDEIRTVIPDAEIFSVALAERLHLRGVLALDDIRHAWRPDDPATTVVVWSEQRGRLERVVLPRHR